MDHFVLITVASVLLTCLIFVKFLQVQVVGFAPEPDRLTMYGFYNILQPVKTVLILLIKQVVLSIETPHSKTHQIFYLTALALYFAELISSTSLRVFYDPTLNLLTVLKSVLLLSFTIVELFVVYGVLETSSFLTNLWTLIAVLFIWAPIAVYMHNR